jgi:NADP-reducing hydrogenase subunit HndB
MVIKNLQELRTLQSSLQAQANLRENGKVDDSNKIEILVGMGTCGLAAGAGETYKALTKSLADKNISDVNVISVGCIGFCHQEPTIQVNIPGKEPVIYGKITKDNADHLVETAIVKRELLKENYLIKSFKKAVV